MRVPVSLTRAATFSSASRTVLNSERRPDAAPEDGAEAAAEAADDA